MLLQKYKNFYNNILFQGIRAERHLGMELLTDATPSIDTYYLFRRRICEYQERTDIDLTQICFEQLAGNQVRLLKISGKCVRMDSKLNGSNIVRQSRYELIHTTLVKFLKTCTLSDLSPRTGRTGKGILERGFLQDRLPL